MSISKATNGSLAKNKKLNEVIDALNSIITMAVREGAEGEGPGFTFGELRSELITTGGGGGSGSGEIPTYGVKTLLVCNSQTGISEEVTFLTP